MDFQNNYRVNNQILQVICWISTVNNNFLVNNLWNLQTNFYRFQICFWLYSHFAQITIFYIICGALVTFSLFFLSVDVGDILENFKTFNIWCKIFIVVFVDIFLQFWKIIAQDFRPMQNSDKQTEVRFSASSRWFPRNLWQLLF